MKIRKEILDFAEEMERVMRKHDPTKGDGWRHCSMPFLFFKLREEYFELMRFLSSSMQIVSHKDDRIRYEAVDIANICLMLWTRLLKEDQ